MMNAAITLERGMPVATPQKFSEYSGGGYAHETHEHEKFEDLHEAFDTLPSISLSDLEEKAALLKRTDRKYLVPREKVVELVSYLGGQGASVLRIEGSSHFSYLSYYFDTPNYELYRAAATARRRRFKLRSRIYMDSGLHYLELKTKNGRKQTVKDRFRLEDVQANSYRAADGVRGEYRGDVLMQSEVRDWLIATMIKREVAQDTSEALRMICSLRCSSRTVYTRSTLRTPEDSRITIDQNLVLSGPNGSGGMRVPHVVVETKSAGKISKADKWLWNRSIRPERVSKYAIGVAVNNPDLAAHRWHSTMKKLGEQS